MAHVLLVNPNRLRPAVAPIALDYIADVLSDRGIAVSILDLCFEDDPAAAIARCLDESDPSLVAVTIRNTDDCFMASCASFIPGHASIITAIRGRTDAPIIVGGSGYSVSPSALLTALGANYGLVGDGEEPLALLAAALASDSDLSHIPGLVWGDGSEIRQNAPWRGAIDSLPRRRALLDTPRYFAEGGQAGIETKRGCDRTCSYCADYIGKGHRVRPRTPPQVADEFEALLAQGVDHIHLCDSEFNVPADHAAAVCEELARRGIGERARWYTYAKPGLSPELARAMRRAGCVGVNFGADSANDGMLRSLGRDFTARDLSDTAAACRGAGLVFMYDLLLGGPGETRESIATTIEAMKRIAPDRVGVSLGVRVYAGTAFSEHVRREGPMDANPNLHGETTDNDGLAKPVFYLSSRIGEDAASYVTGLVGGDRRFFFPTAEGGADAYNYNDNDRLVDAIKRGYRGAYWDILRRLAEKTPAR